MIRFFTHIRLAAAGLAALLMCHTASAQETSLPQDRLPSSLAMMPAPVAGPLESLDKDAGYGPGTAGRFSSCECTPWLTATCCDPVLKPSAFGEFLLMKRHIASGGRDWLFDNGGTSNAAGDDRAIRNSDSLFGDYEPGFRAGILQPLTDQLGIEISGFWIDEFQAEQGNATASGRLELFNGPSFTDAFDGANVASARYSSKIWGLEANAVSPLSHSTNLIAGFRYLSIDENFDVTMVDSGGLSADRGAYRIDATNDLFGLQLGLATEIQATERLSLTARGMTGVFSNRGFQDQIVIDSIGLPAQSVDRRSEKGGSTATWMAELRLGAQYQISDSLTFGIGYEVMYINGLALAPDQMDRTSGALAGNEIHMDDGVFYHGGRASLTFAY